MPPAPDAPAAQVSPLDAWIGLGSNLGDREANLRGAVTALRGFASLSAVSRIYETAPVGYVHQPAFLNAVAHIRTALEPPELLLYLLEIERRAGRDRASAPPQGPRTLDLDVLLLARDGSPLVLHTPALTVPHPRMAERRFVLAPLAELAGQLLDPVTGVSIAALLARLPAANGDIRVWHSLLQA